MRRRDLSLPRFLLLQFCLLFIPIVAWPQTPPLQSRIVERVNEGALVTLRGNTHPLAQPQFDRGAAAPDLPMARMLLVLKRSDAQEAALQKLLDDQQDQNSPSYHQWLTPDAFGQQFGPSDQDIQAVATWLQSHGFQVARIAKGRTVIEFSGTALQVQQAFHTEIHKYTVNGQDHWANASDPQIPQALAPVISGANSMHNFRKTPAHRAAGVFSKSRTTGRVRTLQPGYTFPNTCGVGDCYFVGPYDFATIYNILPLWNASSPIDGTGQSIAIIARSDINVQDVRDFRTLFGLPANDPHFIVDGQDPGLVSGEDETEAVLDVEWSGAVAKGAMINLVVSASTETTDGVDLSAVYAIENNIAPVVSESFGSCEMFLGTTGNSFQNGIREQAAAQGITFLTASDDQAAAGCDVVTGNPPEPATHGLMVNGLASSPYGVAVGGTDFLNFGPKYTINSLNLLSPYWSATNDIHQASALGYVPESTWNSMCTNNIFVVLKYGSTPEASCNNALIDSHTPGLVEVTGGGGGKSNCISSDGANPSSCSGGYPKPSWQSAPGVPADGARDIPDVSLFASSGFLNSAYIICEADQTQSGTCGLSGLEYNFLGIGGTSVSTPSFAGIMAMVNQYTQSHGQGNADAVFYKLASSPAQTNANCDSSAIPASACIFNDVTSGTISAPCEGGSPNCTLSNESDVYGILSGYSAGKGYDLATGLGSVNAYNLVHDWILPGISTTTTLSLNGGNAVNITHGQGVSFNISVSPTAVTGDVSLIGSPTSSGSIGMGAFTLKNGSVSGTSTSLAGGTSYQVKAHYAGDSTYAPSDSAPINVTVAAEPSATLISIPVFDPNSGKLTGDTPSSVVYGSPYIARVDVGNAKAAVTFPMKPVCAIPICPTGSVTLSDSMSGGVSGVFPLNNEGYTEDLSIQLSGGSHHLSASYGGDNSYAASLGAYSLLVTPAPTEMSSPFLPSTIVTGVQVSLLATVSTNVFFSAVPAGTITFYDGGTPISGTVNLFGQAGTKTSAASLTGSTSASFATGGTHQVTAKYIGDANYAAATSSPAMISVVYRTIAAESASSTSINFGDNVTITATVTSTVKNPPMTGTFQFFGNTGIPSAVPTLSTDANGNQVLTASVTTSPQNSNFIVMTYSGDSNFESANASIFVNVILPDFNIGTSASILLIPAGQSGSTQLTLTPTNKIASSEALICNNPLSGSTCSFNPSSPLSLSNGAAASTMVRITTLPPSSSPTTSFVGIPLPAFRRIPPRGPLMLALADALAILVILLLSGQMRPRLATRIGLVGLLWLVLGCGASNSGGGGGNAPSPTSVALSTSAVKVGAGANVTLTATVTSSKAATGTVSILDSASPIVFGPIVSGIATFQISNLAIGTHVLSAQYSGDSNNQVSKTSGAINEVITGTTSIYVVANSPQVSHTAQIIVTIQ